MAPAARQLASHRSELVRRVADLAPGDVALPSATLAERLADWLGWADAIALAAALADDAPATGATAPAGAERWVRARAALVTTMGEGAAFTPTPATERADVRRHVQARQRAMEAGVAALRAQVRNAAAAQSKRLRRLALLDATLDSALAGRERLSLALLPSLLERRWAALRQQHAQSADAAWCARFAADLQGALRAELELRLQPVDGLIDALREEDVPNR